ncbi:membrane fusion protein (multidrug efflux system) [Dysgonomonas hofstadii]|uniref:Membrane fusion protein (Multidrug efflux system) n=1 Tax=Dysgonomonas hofstadii TaxID=637886 RepID=A0A840CLM6_9BACT|nr:efflux RND transporter periplasmic adaptor subunit [Dysgonomonas hofstadii]MBB4035579.1 membrane fusion protein (multidrug efflux system) [Dysgonomonas hofstadii]
MNVKKIVLGATALVVMTSCGNKNANPFGQQDTSPQEYPTQVLSEQDVQLENVYPVTIKGQEDIEIRPRIDGFIDAIYVDEGSVVRKGQILFKINSPSSEQTVNTAKAAIESAQAQVNTAKLNVDRIRPLADKGIVSVTQLNTYENSYQTALATLAQAKATLANANATLGWTNVSSPVDGVVGSIPYRLGSLVNSNNTLTTVSSTSNVFVYFSINEKELVSMLDGLEGKTQAEKINNLPEVTLIMADGTIYPEKGKIKTVTGQVNVTTGTVNFRADFPNKQGILKSGFSGKISIPKHIDNALLIPQKATYTRQDKFLVYKVQGDSVVSTMITVTPTPDGQSYVVTNGLKAGDRIVEDGIITLSNGKKIIVK